MSTTHEINQFNEVVPIYDGRRSNSVDDRRDATELELQQQQEIDQLGTENADLYDQIATLKDEIKELREALDVARLA